MGAGTAIFVGIVIAAFAFYSSHKDREKATYERTHKKDCGPDPQSDYVSKEQQEWFDSLDEWDQGMVEQFGYITVEIKE